MAINFFTVTLALSLPISPFLSSLPRALYPFRPDFFSNLLTRISVRSHARFSFTLLLFLPISVRLWLPSSSRSSAFSLAFPTSLRARFVLSRIPFAVFLPVYILRILVRAAIDPPRISRPDVSRESRRTEIREIEDRASLIHVIFVHGMRAIVTEASREKQRERGRGRVRENEAALLDELSSTISGV